MNACMSPDSISSLLAHDDYVVAAVAGARRPPPRAVVAPFDLPKVIVAIALDDEIATLPHGIPARVVGLEPAPSAKVRRSLRACLARLSASLFFAGGVVALVALPSQARTNRARAGQVSEVVAHVAAAWTFALNASAGR